MENRCYKTVLLLGAVLLAAPDAPLRAGNEEPASVATPDSNSEQLKAIQQEIEALRHESERLNVQENSIIKLLTQFDVESQMKGHEIELLQLKQQSMKHEIGQLQDRYRRQEQNLEAQKQYLSNRLVEAYKLGEMNYLKLMLRVGKTSDILRSYQYITFLAKDDSRKVQMYRQSIQEVEETRLKLEQENRNLVLLRQDLESANEALRRSRLEKVKLLTAVQDQKEMHVDALNELTRAASQLQAFFAEVQPQAPPAFTGVSISKYKGVLDWPVHGRVTREYGNYRHPRFGTTTMSNGVEISAPEGTEVKTVFSGDVVFAEWFKGYGQSVIVSHGDGYYTLYAHNSELLVRRGESVERSQIISKVGSTGAMNGPSLYFEIRKKDQPVNPLEWLRKSYFATRK